MRIKMLKADTVRLDPINSNNYPASWAGDVPDEIAVALIKAGSAVHEEATLADRNPGQQFTDAQAAILAAAADQMLASAQGETEGDGDVGAAPAKALEAMTVAELRELAAAAKIKGFAKMKKPALVAALSAFAAENAAAA